MTKSEACRRLALAALVAGATAVAHEASAKITSNGIQMQGLSPRGTGAAAAPVPARAADPDRLRLRLRAARPAGG